MGQWRFAAGDVADGGLKVENEKRVFGGKSTNELVCDGHDLVGDE